MTERSRCLTQRQLYRELWRCLDTFDDDTRSIFLSFVLRIAEGVMRLQEQKRTTLQEQR